MQVIRSSTFRLNSLSECQNFFFIIIILFACLIESHILMPFLWDLMKKTKKNKFVATKKSNNKWEHR